jgi:hypothetical protein
MPLHISYRLKATHDGIVASLRAMNIAHRRFPSGQVVQRLERWRAFLEQVPSCRGADRSQ